MSALGRRPTAQSSVSASSLLSNQRGQAQLSRMNSLSSLHSSIAEQYSLAASPRTWGTPLDMRYVEADDDLHNPNPQRDRQGGRGGIFTFRGLTNLGCLFILIMGCLMLFAGYPILSHFITHTQTNQGGFNLGGINATGQIPKIPGNYGLIDLDTPKEAYTKKSYQNPNEELTLVFSDEFNEDGRTFYPGDDPYWEAVDLWYWGTVDLEWYDPAQATTKGGSLRLRLDKVDDPSTNHNMSFKSGMIQSWNKFCFTGGLIEASVQLPGASDVGGLWPAVWAMGNLGRAGYGGSLEGLWPYTYDSCDVGTLPNQTYPGEARPLAATEGGDKDRGGVLSYLQGQRLSACTCPGESHPGPKRRDGSYVGRAAPEIDIFEAIVDPNGLGQVSQSAQWAPFNAGYNATDLATNLNINDPDITVYNPYIGGAFQQTTSGLSFTDPQCYERGSNPCFALYGFEYKPGFDNAYITWINNGKQAWTVLSAALGPDTAAEIGTRPVSQEPMYVIANLGISHGFGKIDLEQLIFPATMSVDWIRVYQPSNAINIGCDPVDFPTAAYIETYKKAYTNANLTNWVEQVGEPWPKNSKSAGGCN